MQSPDALHGACRIVDRGVIRARGTDAAKFLQGQLTNDVAGLDAGHARLAGFCSAKGRLQATFIVWRPAADEILLACSASLLEATLKRLSMFVLRAKCKLDDASAELPLWGLAGSAADDAVGDAPVWGRRDAEGSALIRLPDAAGVRRALLVAPAGGAGSLTEVETLSLEAWRWLDVASGIVTIEAATVDRFVPQMVNFELVGGVDFQKGCYPGQEVVARSQYRGTTKRRVFLFESEDQARPGQDVFASGAPDEPSGTVVNAAPNPLHGGSSALIEVRLAVLGSGDLRLGSPDGRPLRRSELPYPVAVDAETAA